MNESLQIKNCIVIDHDLPILLIKPVTDITVVSKFTYSQRPGWIRTRMIFYID